MSFKKHVGGYIFNILKPKPKVNKTELDKAKSKLEIQKLKTKMSGARLGQTNFEIENPKFSKGDFTFDPGKKNVKKASVKNRNKKSKEMFEASKGRKEEKPKHFYVPKNFNKGGRVGLKRGTFPDHSGDGKITKKDILMAKGVIPKPKSKKKVI
tara:strand:- start:124 stop:585 length:462 start_codon:yes stop_codon:yes gene_type:complete